MPAQINTYKCKNNCPQTKTYSDKKHPRPGCTPSLAKMAYIFARDRADLSREKTINANTRKNASKQLPIDKKNVISQSDKTWIINFITMGHHNLDQLDEQILELIAPNARLPFLEVARICGVSGAAIHQRIQKLINLGIIKGSIFTLEPEKLGYDTSAYIGLYLKDAEKKQEVIKKLEDIPEITECYTTTGKYDLFIKVFAKNNSSLMHLIHDKLQPLGLSRTETLIIFDELFSRQIPIKERCKNCKTKEDVYDNE